MKSVFLNSREDYLCVAANCTVYGQKRGWLRVLSLYGLNLVADLTEIIYTKTLERLNKLKMPANQSQQQLDQQAQVQIPTIQAVAVGIHERNINIFFVKQILNNEDGTILEEEKESISFLSYMVQVWN